MIPVRMPNESAVPDRLAGSGQGYGGKIFSYLDKKLDTRRGHRFIRARSWSLDVEVPLQPTPP